MRKSITLFLFNIFCLTILVILYIHSLISISEDNIFRNDIRALVKTLGITDLVLSTDARYTRHPSQADIFSAFQDYPGSIEHFPTGSVIPPPDFNSAGFSIK
jgi:hypothetical protein